MGGDSEGDYADFSVVKLIFRVQQGSGLVGSLRLEVLFDEGFAVGEDGGVVFAGKQTVDVLDVFDAGAGLSREEVGVGVGQNFEAHLVADLLEVLEELVGDVQLCVLAKFVLEDGEESATEPGKGICVGLGEEDIGCLGELLLMIFDEALEAGRHVEHIFLFFDGQDDGGDVLTQVVLDQLDVDLHYIIMVEG